MKKRESVAAAVVGGASKQSMKEKRTKFICDLILIVLNCAIVVTACAYFDADNWARIFVVLAFLLLGITIPAINNRTAYRFLTACSVLAAAVFIAYIALDATGVLHKLNDFESIKQFILSTREWGVVVYVLLTVFQVVVLPIPAAVTVLIGVVIYGPFWAFVLSVIGTYAGSLIAFYLGRTFGKKLVSWMVGEETCKKYADILERKGKGIFIIMLLFPFFPDDILCMVAGITSMSAKFFIISMALTRPIMIAAYAFLGSGEIIPFSGAGIPIWIALFAGAVLLFLLTSAIRKRIENSPKKPKKSTKSKSKE